MESSRTGLIFLGVVAALAGGGWFVYTNLSYGPLEERTGQVIRAEYVPRHEEVHTRKDKDGSKHVDRYQVEPSWRVVIAWEYGMYESRNELLYSQVTVGSEVTLHVRPRLWRSSPVGWSVQSVSAR